MTPSPPPRGLPWRSLKPFSQPVPKLLAVLAALVVWFFATADSRENIERTVTVPLEVRGMNTGGRSYSGVPPTVRVVVSGPRAPMSNLNPRDVSAEIDLSEFPEGDFLASVSATAPGSLRVTSTDPVRVSGLLETEVSRQMPVTISTVTEQEALLPRYLSTPSEVSVLGVSGAVEAVAQVLTVPTTLEPGGSAQVPLIAITSNGAVVSDVQFSPIAVTLRRTDRHTLPLQTPAVLLNPPPPELEVVFALVQPSTARVLSTQALEQLQLEVPYRVGNYTVSGTPLLPEDAVLLDDISVTLEVRQRSSPDSAADSDPTQD